MARKLRLQYEGAIYHVMNRGDRREPIFRDDSDRHLFLKTLAEACQKTDWQIHAWCLMKNHFHLVLETPQANLVSGMKWFLGTYTGRFNRRHKLFGHLFSGRYKSLIVDGSGTGYLRTVCDYVHLNPVRAKLLKPEQRLSEFAWSSYGEYLKSPARRVPWLRVDRLLGEMQIPQDTAAGRRQFQRQMELHRSEDDREKWNGLRRGWCWGDEAFRQELLGHMEEKLGGEHYGAERHETAEAKAERIVREEMKKLGWRKEELSRQIKGHREKVRIALRLRKETTMTLQWIAERLGMGTKTHLAHLLYWQQR
jgi:REP element-mobilizing transposase RayT